MAMREYGLAPRTGRHLDYRPGRWRNKVSVVHSGFRTAEERPAFRNFAKDGEGWCGKDRAFSGGAHTDRHGSSQTISKIAKCELKRRAKEKTMTDHKTGNT